MTKGKLSWIIIIVVLIIDQVIKITVKMNMTLDEQIVIFDWFRIHFIENNGMAYGMTFINKMVLSLFRVVAVIVVGWYIFKQVRLNASWGYIACLSMILAGAAGNILDSMFYGLFFTESTPWAVSNIVGIGDGYASFLMGKVVDMFYFPIIDTYYPDWFPFWGGERFVFFSPVFNFADACISVGVVLMLLFYRKELDFEKHTEEQIEQLHHDQTEQL